MASPPPRTSGFARAVARLAQTRAVPIMRNAWAARRWRLLDGSDPQGQDDVVVVARSLVSNRVPDAEPWFVYPELEPYRHLCRTVGRFEVYDLAGRCSAIGDPCRR